MCCLRFFFELVCCILEVNVGEKREEVMFLGRVTDAFSFFKTYSNRKCFGFTESKLAR